MILKSNQELYLSHGKQFLLGELADLLDWARSMGCVRDRAKVYWYDEMCVTREPTVPSATLRSYRGIYAEIAIGYGSSRDAAPPSVLDLNKALRAAIGTEFSGYKGGEFKMTRNTPVWVGNYGEATGVFVRGVVLTALEEETEMGMVEFVTGDDYWRAEGVRGDGTEARMEGRV